MFDIHIHLDDDKLNQILKNQKIMGENLDAINAKIEAIQSSADNIAGDITKLTEQISGGLTKDEAVGVVTKLTGIADNLKAIADVTQE